MSAGWVWPALGSELRCVSEPRPRAVGDNSHVRLKQSYIDLVELKYSKIQVFLKRSAPKLQHILNLESISFPTFTSHVKVKQTEINWWVFQYIKRKPSNLNFHKLCALKWSVTSLTDTLQCYYKRMALKEGFHICFSEMFSAKEVMHFELAVAPTVLFGTRRGTWWLAWQLMKHAILQCHLKTLHLMSATNREAFELIELNF